MEEKESQKGECAVRPVIWLPRKIRTEDWVLKGTNLITNNKSKD